MAVCKIKAVTSVAAFLCVGVMEVKMKKSRLLALGGS